MEIRNHTITLRELFVEMFRLSAFTFGGGYVIVAMMQSRFVEDKHWLTEEQMLNLCAVAQSAPGVVAVNAAIAVGYTLHGISGLAVSVLATILPPFIIILMICPVYGWMAGQSWLKWLMAGMNTAVCGLIFVSACQMTQSSLKKNTLRNILIILAIFLLSAFTKISIIYIILGSLAAGAIEAGWMYFSRKSKPNY